MRLQRAVQSQAHMLHYSVLYNRRFRKLNPRLKVIKVPKYPRGFLAWVLPSWRIGDDEFLRQVGLDGYMVIRFIRLCRRLCWMATVCGCGILVCVLKCYLHTLDTPAASA
jgi:Late exocytosis, associated with Golgi transport